MNKRYTRQVAPRSAVKPAVGQVWKAKRPVPGGTVCVEILSIIDGGVSVWRRGEEAASIGIGSLKLCSLRDGYVLVAESAGG